MTEKFKRAVEDAHKSGYNSHSYDGTYDFIEWFEKEWENAVSDVKLMM